MASSAAAAAGILLALWGGALGHRSSLRRVEPASLRPEGRAASLPGDAFGATWAAGGSRLAIVMKPDAGVGFLVHVLRLPGLAPAGTVDIGARDVCGLTVRGSTLVALVSSGLCYQHGGSLSILSVDLTRRRVVSTTRVIGLGRVVPASPAFDAATRSSASAAGPSRSSTCGPGRRASTRRGVHSPTGRARRA